MTPEGAQLAGYSGTPLAKKLGLKDGQRVAFVALPGNLHDLSAARSFAAIETVPNVAALPERNWDYIHLFTDSAATVDAVLPELRDRIVPNGMIWVSWPKKAAKVPTDVTENVIRDAALQDVLVDIKVCAVDKKWSALKLVIRKELRATFRSSLD